MLTPMTARKLKNLLAKRGTVANWHVYVDATYAGFTPATMADAIADRVNDKVKFVEWYGNVLVFTEG